MKRLLMVAFHFPPFAGSSGVQRTLRFVQHLPARGWEPIVLTADTRAYEATHTDLLSEVPAGVVVERAFSLDTARHLAVGGRYPAALARPDRWSTWRVAAVMTGLRLIRRYRPAAIWSTFPIATAHSIASSLQRRSTLPWIADFRDPMLQHDYPSDPRTRLSWQSIENQINRNARALVFCAPGAARIYQERYPALPPSNLTIIENGFDEESFAGLDDAARVQGPLVPGRITLVHSGVVYSSERDPTELFAALGRLKRTGQLNSDSVVIRFRASNNDELLHKLAEKNAVADLIELAPAAPYRFALEEMLRADGLVILQASNCNEQIPAKFYEYVRAVRPILALTDTNGDTAAALRRTGITRGIASLDSADEIAFALTQFVADIKTGLAPLPVLTAVQSCTRAKRTDELAALLYRCSSANADP